MVTGMRFGGWTFQQNTRRGLLPDTQVTLDSMLQGGWPFGLKARRIMEQVADFEEAVEAIYTARFAAPSYFIMSGPKPYEGAVVSVDRLDQQFIYPASAAVTPPVLRLNQASGVWHILETND